MEEIKTARALFFVAPEEVEIKKIPLPPLKNGQVLVRTEFSAVSAGSELLIYRGQAPQELSADTTLPSLKGSLKFPLQYGYAAVGRIVSVARDISSTHLRQRVFAFQPHQDFFVSQLDDLFFIPEEVSAEAALFFPNLETAVNIVMDARPLIGEQVAIFGQGVVGLLTTALVAKFPQVTVICAEPLSLRREFSEKLGADFVFDPADPDFRSQLEQVLLKKNIGVNPGERHSVGADLAIELSGNPASLQTSLEILGFGGRLVVGSWYGEKTVELNLGGKFHRNRIQLISSQVSTIAPELSGRWNKRRRFDLIWKLIREYPPVELISHKFPFSQADNAYRLLSEQADQCLQVVFTY